MPMDIEWAKDGITGQLFILQARPETVKSQVEKNVLETYALKERGKVLVQGRSVGEKIGAGPVNVLSSAREIEKFKKGEILVTQMTDPGLGACHEDRLWHRDRPWGQDLPCGHHQSGIGYSLCGWDGKRK